MLSAGHSPYLRGQKPLELCHSTIDIMRRISAIFFLLLLCQNSQSFSPELCSKVCNFSSWLCWLCPEQQKENETNSIDLGDETLGRYLRPLTKAELNEKGQMAHAKFARQQKIVGGSPVSQGQSPWTVRYQILRRITF